MLPRHIKERLEKELERNLALRVENTGSSDSFNVFGRGTTSFGVDRNHEKRRI